MAKIGRPTKPFHPAWSVDPIAGLAKQKDGRWRIIATGERFSESDERRAVQKFLDWKARQGMATVNVPTATAIIGNGESVRQAMAALPQPQADLRQLQGRGTFLPPAVLDQQPAPAPGTPIHMTVEGDKLHFFRDPIQAAALWGYFREQLIADPAYVARMTGLPELAGWRYFAIPAASIKLADIIENYKKHGPATQKAKNEALAPLNRLIEHSGAKTLDDLTTVNLLAFKAEIEKTVPGPATRRAYYSRIKAIIAFGLKTGMDAQQIRAALDRCKVMWTAEPLPPVKPQPISRVHFHALLAVSNPTWRAWLLVGLNCCLHMEEVCDLRWADLDLDKGTYACIRNKTRRQRIPRAATLWPETRAALQALPRRGDCPFVFVSTHGTRFNKNTRINDFKDLRTKAKVPDEVTFDSLRDAAYSAAAHGTTDERIARVLAGHKAAGLQDNYVLRNPEIARPACDAVYQTFGPFSA